MEEAKKMTVKEIVAYVKSFHHYKIDDAGSDWNCQLCGRWNGQKGLGVNHVIYLYPSKDPDSFEGEIISLGSECIKKVKKALKY